MSKRGENIWFRKDGRWEARYVRYYEGKRAVYGYVYAKSYSEVKIKRQEAACLSLNRKDKERDRPFSFLTDAFLCQKKHSVKESTLSCYRNKINAYILPYWKDFWAEDLNSINVNKYIDYLFFCGGENGKKGLSAKTVRDISALLDSIIDFGWKNGILSRKTEITIPRTPRNEIKTLSSDDQKKLIEYLFRDPDGYKAGVLVALVTGMRIGEICALKKNDFDFRHLTVSVSRTLQRITCAEESSSTKIIISYPKSASSVRTVPFAKSFGKWLETFYTGMDDDCYILTGTEKYSEPRNYYKRYRRYLSDCGLGDKGYTFHSLRHTFATEAVKNGVDVKSLSEILGHSGVRITLERYVHPSFEQKKTEIEKFMLCHPLQSFLQSPSEKMQTLQHLLP